MRFTVLTPTYNRAHTLPRVFASLQAQSFRDFEWLIVDDGSTDSTAALVQSWDSDFPIRYFKLDHAGKHKAVNFGLTQVSGDLICQLDSDDEPTPQAFEIFDQHWRVISRPQDFIAVVGLCVKEDGSTFGPRYPAPYTDVFKTGDILRLCGSAQGWAATRADVWKTLMHPEFPGEDFILEGLVWNRMISRFAVRFVSESVLKYVRHAGSLSNSGDYRWRNPRGAFLYYRELLGLPVHPMLWLKAAINAARLLPFAAYRALSKSGTKSP